MRSYSLLPSTHTLDRLALVKQVPLACALAFGLCAAAYAVVDAPVRDAMEAINTKQAQKAFDLLSPLEATRAGDPDFDAALGIAANEVGQFARAVFALERVLATQPENARARAELARALFAIGDTASQFECPGGLVCHSVFCVLWIGDLGGLPVNALGRSSKARCECSPLIARF